jgi:hypothetical protein
VSDKTTDCGSASLVRRLVAELRYQIDLTYDKDYNEGWVAARGCIGGSCPGEWRWYLCGERDLEARDGLMFMHRRDWNLLKEAKEGIA